MTTDDTSDPTPALKEGIDGAIRNPVAWARREHVRAVLLRTQYERIYGPPQPWFEQYLDLCRQPPVRWSPDDRTAPPVQALEPVTLIDVETPTSFGPECDEVAEARAPRITLAEANMRAREILLDDPTASARTLAAVIPCSVGLVCRLPAWRAVQEQRRAGRKPRETPSDPKQLDELIVESAADAVAETRRPLRNFRRRSGSD